MSKRSYSFEFKEEVVKSFDSRDCSIRDFSRGYGISDATVKRWVKKAELYGISSLKESNTWKRYSQSLKLQAVKDYQSGKYSKIEIARYYLISDSSVLVIGLHCIMVIKN